MVLDDVHVQVHGGLSFSEEGKFGFDCDTLQDLVPAQKLTLEILPAWMRRLYVPSPEDAEYRDHAYVKNQVHLLAEQFVIRATELKKGM